MRWTHPGTAQIHWFSIINSLAIVLLLTGIVAMMCVAGWLDPRAAPGSASASSLPLPVLLPLPLIMMYRVPRPCSMMRTLRRDFNRYNEHDKEDLAEESGWKLVHADVFRPPPNAILLVSSLGTGMQLLFCAVVCIFCASACILCPEPSATSGLCFRLCRSPEVPAGSPPVSSPLMPRLRCPCWPPQCSASSRRPTVAGC